jgi:beta-N-acetylhexosaminidase
VRQAVERGLLSPRQALASARRILGLKKWLARRPPPPLSVVASRAHLALAREVADRSVTRVRDRVGLLPLRLPSEARVAVVVPRPADLTPADTSSYLVPALAAAVRRHHARADEVLMSMNPSDEDVRHVRQALAGHDLVIVGTINATSHPGQAAVVDAVLARGRPAVTVALRMPYDLQAYPGAAVHACTYGILPPSMEALADALWGRVPFRGRLPVTLPARLRR